METVLTGAGHRFGNNIDTDQIYPGKYLALTDPTEIGAHCLEGADPAFAANVRVGDFVVAGSNFGCGSSREHAAITLKQSGVAALIARSFARIFYRNVINLGLPAIVCDEVDAVAPVSGARLRLDLTVGTVTNLESGVTVACEPLTGYSLEILEAGGIKPLVRKRLQAEQA